MDINFDLNKDDRLETWNFLTKQLEAYYFDTASLPVSLKLSQQEIANYKWFTAAVWPLITSDMADKLVCRIRLPQLLPCLVLKA